MMNFTPNSITLGVVTLCLTVCDQAFGNPEAKRLFEDLVNRYNKLVRPARHQNVSVDVKFRVKLAQIIDVHEKNQIMICNVWLYHEWYDYRLSWDPQQYGGVSVMYVPSELIWLPDIVLYNNADGKYQVTIMTKATLNSSGKVVWEPPAIFKSMCPIDVEWFPFDRQTCLLKFGSWTYNRGELDLLHAHNSSVVEEVMEVDQEKGLERVLLVKQAIDFEDYYKSVEWDIMSVPGKRHEGHYPCCPQKAGYVDITYYIVIRRKTGFYVINFIAPCLAISLLTLLTFYLPSDCGEKIALCISILISETVFFLLLVEIIPSTSLVLPLIGRYLLFTMILVSLSIAVTVITINAHFAGPYSGKIPRWTRKLFFDFLPKILRIKTVPEKAPSTELAEILKLFSDKSRWTDQNSEMRLKEDEINQNIEPTQFHSEWSYFKKEEKRQQRPYSCFDLGSSQSTQTQRESLKRLVELDWSDLWKLNGEATQRASEELIYISRYYQRKRKNREVHNEWHFVAIVLDRLFLIGFTIASISGTLGILLQAPSLYDSEVPIA